MLFTMTMNTMAQEAFCIAKDGKAATIVVDNQDWKGVLRAANDLADDIRKVAGTAPLISPQLGGSSKAHQLLPQSGEAGRGLPIYSYREGEVPGIHSVRYDSEADCITITHDAHSRKGFALGAVLAAEYTKDHEGLLSIGDLFDF